MLVLFILVTELFNHWNALSRSQGQACSVIAFKGSLSGVNSAWDCCVLISFVTLWFIILMFQFRACCELLQTLVKVSFRLSFCYSQACVSAVFQPSMSQ